MTQREVRAYLQDIIEGARVTREHIGGHTLDDYERSILLQDAVERRLAIIGEALNRAIHIHPALEDRIPNAGQVIAFRNRLVHVYTDIDPAVVWEIVHDHLPTLVANVERVLREPSW